MAGSVWVSTGYVFTTEHGEPCDPRNALRALKVRSDKAGLPARSAHAAALGGVGDARRRRFAKVVSEILGHSSVGITGDVYGHVSPDVSAQAMDALDDALDAANGGRR